MATKVVYRDAAGRGPIEVQDPGSERWFLLEPGVPVELPDVLVTGIAPTFDDEELVDAGRVALTVQHADIEIVRAAPPANADAEE